MPRKRKGKRSALSAVKKKSKADLTEIVPGLFVGGKSAAADWETLSSRKITHIVCLASKCHFADELHYCKAHIKDSRDSSLSTKLPEIFEFIGSKKEGSGCLIHCEAGMSRSPSVCIAYLMKLQQCSFDEAYSLVKSKRRCIRPNPAFVSELKQLKADGWFESLTDSSYKSKSARCFRSE